MAQIEIDGPEISLTVNGEARVLPAGTTVATLLTSLELHPRMVVVELNRVIVRDRDSFATTELRNGDSLELVHFVGGG